MRQIIKPSPKCPNCKTYLEWYGNFNKGYESHLERGQGDYGKWNCPKCYALYKGKIAR